MSLLTIWRVDADMPIWSAIEITKINVGMYAFQLSLHSYIFSSLTVLFKIVINPLQFPSQQLIVMFYTPVMYAIITT